MIKVNNLVVLLFVVTLITSCGDGTNGSIENQELRLPSVQQKTSTEKLKSDYLAQQSEVDSLLNSSHETSWAYFRDQSLTKWYISHPSGTTYALGRNSIGHSSWITIANQVAVANIDFLNKIVSLNSSTAILTPSDSYLAISLVGGEAQQYVNGDIARQWAALIAGNTVNSDWYFFRVESTQTWYIVWIAGTNSTILRLGLNASLDDYDWKKPLDGSGVAVDTSSWTKEFFQENGIWKVRFNPPTSAGSFNNTLNSFQWPIPLPIGATIDSQASEIYAYGNGFEFLDNTAGTYISCGSDNSAYEANLDVNYHPGIDINVKGTSGNQDKGTPVFAIADGTVTDINSNGGSIVIEHPAGNGTSVWANYRHASKSSISVSIGDTVKKGRQIAQMGNEGTPYSHLHFEIRKPEHPSRASATAWCLYGGKSYAELKYWLHDPLDFVRTHK